MSQLHLFPLDHGTTPADEPDERTNLEREVAHWRAVEARYAPLMALSDEHVETARKKDLVPIVEALGFDFAKQYRLAALKKWMLNLKRSHERARIDWAEIVREIERRDAVQSERCRRFQTAKIAG